MSRPALYRDIEKAGNRYSMAIVATWREAKAKSTSEMWIPFSKERLVHHGIALHELKIVDKKVSVKNVPDVVYTFRARADLPGEILASGHYAIVGEGKGHYAFAKIPTPNRFKLPTKMKSVSLVEAIPAWAQEYMGTDEQGTLTRVAENKIVKNFLGLSEAFRLQSHMRTTAPKYGQVEIDEIYIGLTTKKEPIIIGIEAKDKSDDDLLNVAQLFGSAQVLRKIFPDLPKKLLGMKPDSDGRICVCEFNVASKPHELTPLSDWKAYLVK